MSETVAEVEFYRDEITDREFYSKLSKRSHDPAFSKELEYLASVEQEHAGFWSKVAASKGVKTENIGPFRRKLWAMLFLSRILGEGLTIKMMEFGEIESVRKYRDYVQGKGVPAGISNEVEKILQDEIEHESVFQQKISSSEKTIQRNRDVVYGISDSLVEVLAAIAGLTAILNDGVLIALGGIVVGVGGTISMTVGAYLAKISESEHKLRSLAKKALFDGTDVKIEEADKIRGEGLESATNVGLFYLMGVWVPIIPFLFLPVIVALVLAVALVAITEALVNAIVAISIGVPARGLALKSSVMALLAAGATYALGYALEMFFHIGYI
ncbi:MAG: VIT1/CCC1 family protein [Candidatus Thermoplasmatota archaeon]|nr:VIT1/CCC1 family protein [Candidatus Thermoplasmatota archaeon]